MRFSGKSVLLLGGNSGIGLSAAKAFIEEGAKVVLTGRNPDTVQAAMDELHPHGAVVSDISDLAGTRRTVEEAAASLDGLDVLFINAGVGAFSPVAEVTEELWDQVHGINLKGCYFAAQAALPHLRSGGSIVFTGSTGSILGIPGNSIYAAAKAGLRAFARILAAELVQSGIRVNVVSPGPTETPIITRNIGQAPGEEERLRAIMTAAVPMHRMGTPEEIANAVLFLASDEASFITGIDLFVDGGIVELEPIPG